jgi:membrane protein required for colicin V production
MSLIDLAILAVLLVSALFAFRRGFSRESAALFGWAATLVATYFVFPFVRPFAAEAIPFGIVGDAIGLFVTFFGSLWVVSYVLKRMAGIVKAREPNNFDRSLGFVYGLGRGFVLVTLAFWFLGVAGTDRAPPGFVAQASLYPLIDTTAFVISAIVPQAGAQGARGVASNADPAYVAPAGADEENGYADSERQALDQLIESTSGD